MTVSFIFNVKPKPKQSTLFGKGHCRTDPKIEAFERTIKILAKIQFKQQGFKKPMSGAVCIEKLKYTYTRPKNHYNSKGLLKPKAPKYKITRPDLDNLTKPILDALNKTVFNDDNQIFLIENISKVFGTENKIELTLTEISEMTGEPI